MTISQEFRDILFLAFKAGFYTSCDSYNGDFDYIARLNSEKRQQEQFESDFQTFLDEHNLNAENFDEYYQRHARAVDAAEQLWSTLRDIYMPLFSMKYILLNQIIFHERMLFFDTKLAELKLTSRL